MADFYVPIATNTLSSIDSLIANASGAGKVGEAIGNLPDAYWAGQNQAYQQRNRNAFQSGDLPRTTQGLADALLRIQGTAAAPEYVALSNLGGAQEIARRPDPTGVNVGNTGYTPPTQSETGPPSSAVPSTASVVGDAEGVQRGLYEPPAAAGQRPPIQGEAVSPQRPQAQPLGFGQRFAGAQPQPPASGAMGEARPVRTVQVQAPQVAQGPPQAAFSPDTQPQQLEATAARAEEIAKIFEQRRDAAAGYGNKELAASEGAKAEAYHKQAQDIRNALLTRYQPTPGQRDYEIARRQGYAGTFQQYQTDQEAGKAEAVKQAASLSKLAEAGIDAKGKLAQLNEVQRLGEKVGYGAVPKLQSFLGNYGINTTGLSDIQAYERAIDFMAPQLRPVGSGRLMQKELAAFKSSLGGLMTTPEGRRISVENLKLIHEFSTEVGGIAADSSLGQSERLKKIYDLPEPKLSTTWTGPTGVTYVVRDNKIIGRTR